jgi:hypothetical protein
VIRVIGVIGVIRVSGVVRPSRRQSRSSEVHREVVMDYGLNLPMHIGLSIMQKAGF